MGKVLDFKGQPIVLNQLEAHIAQAIERKIKNDLGFDIDITTLTQIVKKVTLQKFFEIMPADFMPVRVGEGAWSQIMTTYRSFALADDFSTGIINTGGQNSRLAAGDAGVDAINVPVKNWAKEIGWTIFDIQQAAKSGNWDLITAKEEARLKNWQLGIQKVAFLGLAGDAAVQGLLSQSVVVPNTTLIVKAISAMSNTELSTFLQGLLAAYRIQVNFSAWPSHFAIPETDYLGLATPSSSDFPIRSKLNLIEETLQTMTKRKDFKILPCAYGDKVNNSLGVQRYALYNGVDDASIRMDIPVDYTNTLANSVNSFQFQNVGYGQFTGVGLYRPLELMYMQY